MSLNLKTQNLFIEELSKDLDGEKPLKVIRSKQAFTSDSISVILKAAPKDCSLITFTTIFLRTENW